MPSTEPKRTQRLRLLLSADELAAVEEFRFRARMPSLAAAARELVRRGMASVKNDQ